MDITLDGGKYTVVNDNGKLSALRYGEPWRDCAGDGLMLALVHEIESLTRSRDLAVRRMQESTVYAIELRKKLNKYEPGAPMHLNAALLPDNVGREWAATAHSVVKNGDHAGRRCGSIRRTC